jgi:hypothetical protein
VVPPMPNKFNVFSLEEGFFNAAVTVLFDLATTGSAHKSFFCKAFTISF